MLNIIILQNLKSIRLMIAETLHSRVLSFPHHSILKLRHIDASGHQQF